MFTYAALLIIVPIFVFAIANYEATPAQGVSTVADVVAYQKKAEETLAQIYRYCNHAACISPWILWPRILWQRRLLRPVAGGSASWYTL